MALSAQLGGANLTPESIQTTANLKMEKLDSGWAITAIHLDVTARIPGADSPAAALEVLDLHVHLSTREVSRGLSPGHV